MREVNENALLIRVHGVLALNDDGLWAGGAAGRGGAGLAEVGVAGLAAGWVEASGTVWGEEEAGLHGGSSQRELVVEGESGG